MDPNTEEGTMSDDGQGRSEGAASGASDLDSLLSEYQEGTKPKAEAKVVPDLSKLEPVIRFAEAEMQNKQRETFDKDVNAAVEKVREGEEFKSLPAALTRRMLVAYAFDNQDFDAAFQNRAKNPTAWDTALDKARSELAEEVKDLNITARKDRDDIEAAKATVDGITVDSSSDDDGPSVIELSKMSDTEWRNYLDEELRKVS